MRSVHLPEGLLVKGLKSSELRWDGASVHASTKCGFHGTRLRGTRADECTRPSPAASPRPP